MAMPSVSLSSILSHVLFPDSVSQSLALSLSLSVPLTSYSHDIILSSYSSYSHNTVLTI